jgi:uncharacterized protein (DUF488 family)
MPRIPDLLLPTDPVGVQVQNKAEWNEVRAGRADFYTVGYMRRHIDSFLAALTDAGVETVLDVRHVAVSMYRPEFSKSNLTRHLASVGISYLHLPQFGVPRDIRGRAAGHDSRDAIWEWYDEHVIPTLTLHGFFNWADHPVALLCTEFDPTSCHRHRLALELERYGLRGFDL